MFASLSGAFLAHLILLVFVVAIPRTQSAGSSLSPARPREVTVMMGELMERLERERLQQAREEEKQPEPPAPESRPFVSTDLNQAEAAAPENARYESDRNTSAASRLRPDASLPRREDAPTLAGNNPLPHLNLENRDYVEGKLDTPPASPDPSAKAASPGAAAPTPPVPPAATQAAAQAQPQAQTPNGGAEAEGAFSAAPPKETAPPKEAAREERDFDSPDGELASTAPDPLAPAIGNEKADESESEPDPLASATQEGAMAVGSPDSPPPSDASPGLKPADDGLFSKKFTPEERQNAINGGLAKDGDNAVDAAATPMGRYKKRVRDLISQKWHRYRQDNADFVTWGILKLEFTVDPSGRVRNLEITKNEANSILAEFSLRAIRDADLPPMPPEVAESVGSKGLVIQYDIIIY